jgi:hypothetical protein
MTKLICEICKVNKAIGFIQTYYKDTGEIIEDSLGPIACDPCARTICDDEDITSIE